jgi:nicotinate-nucleotide adenylyltransferase
MNMPDPTINKKKTQDPKQQHFQRIGILGGTFDPVHFGHITPAIENAKWLALDQLYLLPAHIPPHKNSTIATAEQRKSMVELVCQNSPLLQMDDRELAKNTPSYTVESIKEISYSHKNTQLFFIIGMDSLLNFTSWYQWENILKHCHLVVNIRPNYELRNLSLICQQSLSEHFINDLNEIKDLKSGKILFHQQIAIDISSTEIRCELQKNIFNEEKLPSEVINYIKQNNLYK